MNLVNKKNIITLLTATLGVVLFFAFQGVVFAQTESFSFDVVPKNPKPLSDVRVSISSFSVDLDRATITWTLDGSLISSGVGDTTANFKTKSLGEVSVLKVKALFANGEKLEKTLAVQPAHLDILWEAPDSYTPPFYKGKALPTPESTIKVVAVPEIENYAGSKYNPSSLVYTWKKGTEVQQGVSGFNKQHFVFKHNLFDKDQRISVEATSQDGFSSAQGSSMISIVDPIVAVYKEDPKKGVDYSIDISRSNTSAIGRTSLVAVPYFFSTETGHNQSLSYEWSIDKNRTNPFGNKNKITLEREGDSGGTANIEVSIKSLGKLFQDGRRIFSLDLR